MMTSTLTILNLTKSFAGVQALQDVSLSVAPGERVALLGHNGAGKSTLMKIVLGLIAASGGTVGVCGAAPGSAVARGAVAYLPENAAFHPSLTGLEQIRHYLALRGESRGLAMELLEKVGLGQAAGRRIGTYSKGMRQRVGLAQALIGQPRLLVLDEPTSGLDPVSRRDFYALLDGLAAQGASILLSSHALTEVEARTDRIVILSQGKLVAQGALGALRQQADLPVTMQVTAAQGQGAQVARLMGQRPPPSDVFQLQCTSGEKLALLAKAMALGDLVADVDLHPPSLEDLYSHFNQREGQS
jgi:Cu-processing system ATP-binding protein